MIRASTPKSEQAFVVISPKDKAIPAKLAFSPSNSKLNRTPPPRADMYNAHKSLLQFLDSANLLVIQKLGCQSTSMPFH